VTLSYVNRERGILPNELEDILDEILDAFSGSASTLIVPPDATRSTSFSGEIVEFIHKKMGHTIKSILPATGTHRPMTSDEIKSMFGSVPESLFNVHDWRTDSVYLGELGDEFISHLPLDGWNKPWKVKVNREIISEEYDLIISVGQVVPHEVAGMANHSKNILIGLGGPESIHDSHYIGALYGIDKTLGKTDTPVRLLMNEAQRLYLPEEKILYILTVVQPDEIGTPILKGVFAGKGMDCFYEAASLAKKENITIIEKPVEKMVVFLDPKKYQSTWLGNKAIYRTRLAMADNGELIILAPGIKKFGEDKRIDSLIREYGYQAGANIREVVSSSPSLSENLAAAAHLSHGNVNNRFKISYCCKHLSKSEIESVGYSYRPYDEAIKEYPTTEMKQGWNQIEHNEEVYYIHDPGAGLWTGREL